MADLRQKPTLPQFAAPARDGRARADTIPAPASEPARPAESSVRPTANPVRATGVEFLDGIASGWRTSELVAWCRKRLLLAGYLRLLDPMSGRFLVREEGCAPIHVATLASDDLPARDVEARKLLETARGRVIERLEGMVSAPPDDRFVHAAIYAGRVARETSKAKPTWTPSVVECERLSDWVLAFFAADVLGNREEYDRRLVVCEECGKVEFRDGGGDRRRCTVHQRDRRSGQIRARPSEPPIAKAGTK